MSYTPQDTISKTSCKECIFAIYNGNTQTGCEDNRISKFESDVVAAYDNDKEFFVINRLCTLYRPNEWNNGIKDIQKAKSESHMTFDVLIDCNNIDEAMFQYLNALLPQLHEKICVRFFYSHKSQKDIINRVNNLFFDNPNKAIVSLCIDEKEYIYLNIMQSTNSFHILLNETNYHSFHEFIDLVNKNINEDLRKALIFKRNDKIAISNLVCRTLFQNLYLDYKVEYPKCEQSVRQAGLYLEL